MDTARQSEATWLVSLSAPERARFFALLAHDLTIAVRELAHGRSEVALEQVRQLNEALHRVTGYLAFCVAGNEDTRWLSVVVSSVLGLQDQVAAQQSQQAWSEALGEFNQHVA
jgi:hypothetical protein